MRCQTRAKPARAGLRVTRALMMPISYKINERER